MEDNEGTTRDEKCRAGKAALEAYQKKMDSKKKKKKSAKTKSAETKSGSSPDDEYTNSQSSNLMSLGDSYPNFSEEDISEMSVPKVASGSGVSPEKSDNSILEPSSPGGEHTDGWTGSSVHKLESEPAVGQTDNLLVDSGLGATKSFTPRLDQVIQPGALEGEWHDYGRPFSGADNDFSSTMLDPSLIPGLDSGLETAQTPQHSQVQFPLTSNSQNGDGSGPFGIGEEGTRPIDDHKPLLPTCEDSWSPLQSQAQEEDLRQQISSLKTAHKNELETVHSSFALKMENYHKQVEEAANAQIQAQYASLETAVRLQQKQNEDSQAALLSTLDKEQSLRTDLEDEIQSLRQNSSYLQAKPNEQEQLQSAYDDLERKFHQTAADCDTKIVDLTSKWQKEKDQLLKELDHYVTEARSLSFTDFEAQLQKLTLQLEDSQNRESEIDQSFNDLKAQSSALERDKEDAAAHLEQVMQGHEKEMSELKSALQQERDYLAGNQILLNEQHKEKNTAAVEQEAALRQMFQQEKAEIAERFRQQEDVLRQQEAMWQERFYAEKDRTHTLEEHLDELVTCKEALREYEDVNRNLLSQMESLNQNLGQSENANEMLAEDNRIFQAAKEKIEKELDILTSKCRQQDAKMTELSKSIETNQSAPVYGASTQVGAPEDVRSGPESEILKQISSISLKADATLLKALESAGIKSHGSVSDVVGDLCSSVSASSSEIVSLEEKGDALQGVVDSLLEKQKDLSIQLESATKEVETLKGDSLGRDRLVQVEEQLKKDLSAKDALVEKLIAENENLEVQLATRDVGEDSGKARVGRIVSGMSDLESQVREDHDRLTRKLKERESLEAELAKQTTVLKRKEDEKKMLEALIGEKAKLEQELLDQKQHLQNSLDAIQEKMRIQKLKFEQQSTEKERDHSRNMAALRDEQNQLNTDHKLELERLNRLLEVSVDENKSLNEIFDEEATNRQRLEEKVSALKEQNAGQKQHLFDQLAQLRRELDGAHQQKVQELLEESASRRTTVEADYDAKLSDLSREHLRKVEKTHESHATEVAELKSAIERHEGTIQNLKLALDADSTGKEQLHQQLEALQNREEELKREFVQEMNKFKAGVDSAHQQKLQDLHQQSQAAVEAELEAAQKAHSHRVAELVEEQSRKIGELQTESASKVAELKSAIEKHEGTIQNLKLAQDAEHQQLEALQNREEELKREFVQEMNKFKAGVDSAHQQKLQDLHHQSQAAVEAELEAAQKAHSQRVAELVEEQSGKIGELQTESASKVAELKSAIEKHEGTIQNLKLALDADSTGKEQLHQQLEALQNREEELKREFAQEMNKFKAGVDSAHQQKLQDLHQQSQAAVEAELEAAQKAHSHRVAELVEEQSRKIGELQTESASKVVELKSAIEKHEGTIQNLKLALDADSTGKEQLHQQLEALQNREEELKREFVQEMNKFKAGVDSAHQQKLQDLHQQSQAAVEAELEAAQKAHSQRVAELVEEQSGKIGELQTENASKVAELKSAIEKHEGTIQNLKLALDADSTGKEQLLQQLEALQNREEELKREFVQEMNKFKAGVDSAHQQKLQDLHHQSQAAVEAELEAAQKAHSQRVAELVEEQSRKIGELQTESASKMERLEGIIASQEQAIQSLHLSLEEERGRAKAEADQLRDAHLEEKKSFDQALQSKCESLADMTEKHEMLMANLSQVQADTVRSLMEKVSSLDDQLKETSKQAGELEERLGQEQAEALEREANLLDVQAALNSHNASALTVVKLCNDLLQLRQSTPSSASSESREIPEVNSLVGKVQKVKDLVLSKNGEIESLQAERVRLEEQVVALTATAPVTTCNVGVQSQIPPREKGEVVLSNLLVDAAIVSAKESLKSEAEVEKVRQANSIALDELLRKHDQQLSDLQNALLLEHKQQNELLSQKFREDLQRALACQEESLNEARSLEIDGIKQSAGLEVAALTHANREQQQALQNLQHLAGEQEAAVGALKSELAQDRLNHQQEVSRLKGLFASSARGLQEEVDGRNRSELESNLQALQLVHRQEKNKLIQLHQRDLARFEADLAEAHTKWRDLDALLTDKQRLLDTVRAEATADVESLKNEINILQGQLKAERERSVFDTEEKNKMLHHMRGSHGVSGSHPLLERNEFSLVDTILLQKIEALTPVLKEEARELSQLTDLLNSANLPESKSAATYTEGTSPSVIHLTQQQDGRTPVEELSSMVARLAAEKADLQAQLAELQDQLRVARMDLERAGLEKAGTERAHSSDARRLQWQLTSSAQGLEDAKDRLRQEQAQLLECQLMLSRKDQDLVKQAAKVKALSDELHLSKARAQSLSASLQRNQQELNNAQRIIREYLSLVGRPAGPEAGAGHREHPAQLESPLSAGCVELLQHVQATQDQLDTAKGKLAAKQMDMKRLQKLYHKSESHRRNLAFQKFYLTQKVDSFFHTQQAAFDILQDMGLVDIVRLHQQSPCTHPRQRFRARVWVVIAHLRLLHFWRRAKQVS